MLLSSDLLVVHLELSNAADKGNDNNTSEVGVEDRVDAGDGTRLNLFHQLQKTINTAWKFPGNLTSQHRQII